MYLVQVYFSMMKDQSIFLSTHTFVCIVYSRLLVYHHHKKYKPQKTWSSNFTAENMSNIKNDPFICILLKKNPKCTNVQSGVRCKVVFLLQCTLYCGGWSGTLEEDIEENNNTRVRISVGLRSPSGADRGLQSFKSVTLFEMNNHWFDV